MLTMAVLGSGKGSNLGALLEAIDAGRLSARVVTVLSDVPDAYILERARQRGIPAHWVDCAPYRTKLEGLAEDQVLARLREAGAEWVVLAGFMRMIKQKLLDAYAGRIINIHPSLLPAFPGLAAWRQALEYGVKVSGCTVHFVDAGMDSGPVILQRTVPVLDDDTPETLHARIQVQEHSAYPEALQQIAAGQAQIVGRKVILASAAKSGP